MNTNGATPLFEDASASDELRSFVVMARGDGPSQANLDRLAARLAPAVGLSAAILVSGAGALGTAPIGVKSALQRAVAKAGLLGKLFASTGGKLLALGLTLGVGAGLWALTGLNQQKEPVTSVAVRTAGPVPTVEAPHVAPVVTAPPLVAPAATIPPRPMGARTRLKPAAQRALVQPTAVAEPRPSELSLIQQAEAARGNSAEALAVLARHEQLYPSGALAQERDVLAVEMLLKAGNTAQARARAQRFEAAHPGSAHISRLRALLERAPQP